MDLTKPKTTTISAADVTSSELTKDSYEVVGGTLDDGGVQARILCQPAGSSVYYQDTRLADGKLQIDMTKTVQF